MKFSILFCILASSLIENINAGNLDPLKGCVDPGTRDELQASINIIEANIPDVNTRTLTLCSDTKIRFKEKDDRIYIDIKAKEFVLKCESAQTCVIDGGNTGRHQKGSRELFGDGGFLLALALVTDRTTLHIEGIKFSNFGVTHHGGVISVFTKGTFQLYLFKCMFSNNYAKHSGGAIFYHGDGEEYTETYIKDCIFKNNESDLYGGGIAFRARDAFIYVYIKGTHFYDNWAKQNGGGLMFGGKRRDNKQLIIKDSTFKNNKASYNGGGCYVSLAKPFELTNSEFKDNTAVEGEAYWAFDCNLKFDDTDFNKDTVREVCLATDSRVNVILNDED